MSNTRVTVLEIDEMNLQVMIYYINYFKRVMCTCSHVNYELAKVLMIYHQQDMEEAHKDPVMGASVHTPIQRNSTYVQIVKQSIYDNR